MSKENEITRIPRVEVTTDDRHRRVISNFRLRGYGRADDPTLRGMLELSEDWTSYCIAARTHFPVTGGVGSVMLGEELENVLTPLLREVAIGYEELDEEGSWKGNYSLHDDDVPVVSTYLARYQQVGKAAKAMERSMLSALIAEFDYFMQRLFRSLALKKRDAFVDEARQYTLREISSNGGIDGAYNAQIEATISSKLRGSHADMISWAAKVLELEGGDAPIKRHEVYRKFIEVCQRRHLLAHNGGVVSAEYRRKCMEAGWKDKDLPAEGKSVEGGRKYLSEAVEAVFEVGLFILHLAIQKLFQGDRVRSYESLLNSSHELVKRGLNDSCRRVCEFAEYSKKHFDHRLTLMFGINRALSALFDRGLPEAEQTRRATEIIDSYDWSLGNPIFDLALACVRRKFDGVHRKATLAAEYGMSYADARTFAVSKEAREIDGFLECFPRAPVLLQAGQQESAGKLQA